MSVNSKRTKTRVEEKHENVVKKFSHKNHMGGESYSIANPIRNLKLAAASCFFGEPMYYPDKSEKPDSKKVTLNVKWVSDTLNKHLVSVDVFSIRDTKSSMLESAIDKALDYSVEETLKVAVELRNEDNIRTTPQVILVRAANHPRCKNTNLISVYGPSIVSRADEPAVCMAYQLSKFGKPVPNSLKRLLKKKLESFDDYALAKYRMENRTVKTVDVVNIVHASSTSINKLCKGSLKLDGDIETWESMRSAGKSWEDCIEVMGHMALLRNLRNFEKNSVKPELYLDKLLSTAKNAKQLPFRYFSAYQNISHNNPKILDTLENCMEISLSNVPKFSGKSISLCDNSGSACGTFTSSYGSVRVNEIANLSGIITGKNSDEGYVGVFGDRLDIQPIRKRSSIFETLTKLNKIGSDIGGGTENGIWIFFRDAIKNKEHYDNIFVYSDMQAGHGGLYGINPSEYRDYSWGPDASMRNSGAYQHIDVAALVNKYRKEVNKNVNVFLVQVAGYQDTIIPEFYDKTFILGGWSDGVLRFAHRMINMYGNNKQN